MPSNDDPDGHGDPVADGEQAGDHRLGDDQAGGEHPATQGGQGRGGTGTETAPSTRHAVFRSPGILLLVALFIAVCATPLAISVTGMPLVYLVPLGIAVWVLRVRTTVSTERIVVRTVFTKRVLDWSQITGLRLTARSHVDAVLADDSRVRLPTVRTRHIPVMAALSGGRLPDPSGILPTEGGDASADTGDATDVGDAGDVGADTSDSTGAAVSGATTADDERPN